jgi:hypothetical protein
VAQGVHWFDFDKFYNEVNRVSKKESGRIAVWSYGMHKIKREAISWVIFGQRKSNLLKKIIEQYHSHLRRLMHQGLR